MIDHDLVQRFPPDVRDRGITGRESHGEQHQELLVLRPAQQGPEGGTAVERSGGECDQTRPLDGGQQQTSRDTAGDLVIVMNLSLAVLQQSVGLFELQYQVRSTSEVRLDPVSSHELLICCPLKS